MPDKELTCLECGNGFTWTEEEQEAFRRKGLREPKRCPECHRYRQESRRGRIRPQKPPMHEITCSRCGKNARVPFKPRPDRPVYCDGCFRAVREPD